MASFHVAPTNTQTMSATATTVVVSVSGASPCSPSHAITIISGSSQQKQVGKNS